LPPFPFVFVFVAVAVAVIRSNADPKVPEV
jgi:hypothetical protein